MLLGRKIVQEYYHKFDMGFSTKSFTADWQSQDPALQWGVQSQPLLFVLIMEMVIRESESVIKRAELGLVTSLPPLRAFMDEITKVVPKAD